MSIFIEMYCILLIINSIVFSAVHNNSLQFKKQSEMLKHYEGEHCKFTKKACLPHCFHFSSGVTSFFFNLRGTAAKLLVNERYVPSGAESKKKIKIPLFPASQMNFWNEARELNGGERSAS